MANPNPLLSAKDIAGLLGVSKRLANRMLARGDFETLLISKSIRRVTRDAFDAYLTACTRPAVSEGPLEVTLAPIAPLFCAHAAAASVKTRLAGVLEKSPRPQRDLPRNHAVKFVCLVGMKAAAARPARVQFICAADLSKRKGSVLAIGSIRYGSRDGQAARCPHPPFDRSIPSPV